MEVGEVELPGSGESVLVKRLTIGILACLLAIRALASPNVVLVMADDMGWAQTGY